MPTDDDLERLGVRSVVDLDLVVLEGKVDLSFLREKHGSADVLAESERALVEKLDRFLFHLFGRLGLRDGGSIKTPGSTVSLARPRARRPRGSGMKLRPLARARAAAAAPPRPHPEVSLIPRYITREQLAAMSQVSDTLQSMQSKKDE